MLHESRGHSTTRRAAEQSRGLSAWIAGVGLTAVLCSPLPIRAQETVIDFEDLAPGTVLERQYEARGVVFSPSGFFDSGLPFIERIAPGLAHSGTQVADIRNCSGEFCASSVFGKFTATRRKVRVFAGNLAAAGSSRLQTARVTLFVYSGATDPNGNRVVLDSATASVTVGAGFNTLLEIGPRAAADIDSFEVRGEGFNSLVGIDDLTFDTPLVGPPPDFDLSRTGPVGAGMRQGFSAAVTITVNRKNGSNGNILLAVGGLPDGVSAVFAPNPVPGTGASSTMTLTAKTDATLATGTSISVTGTPAGPSVGPTAQRVQFPLTVAPNFKLKFRREKIGGDATEVPPCTTVTMTVQVYVPFSLESTDEPGTIPSAFSGSVALSFFSFGGSAFPPGVDASFSPAAVSVSGSTGGESTLSIRANASLTGDLTVAILGTSPPYPATALELNIRWTKGSIISFTPTSGDDPRALQPGTEITLLGNGFCLPADSTRVQFGNNPAAEAKAASVSADGRQIRVRVPRLATDGPLTVKTTFGSYVSTSPFTVRGFRGTNGFAFQNDKLPGGWKGLAGDVGYDDLTEAFGKEQTYLQLTVDPCDLPPLNLAPCFRGSRLGIGVPCSCPVLSISTIPKPLGVIALKIIQSQLDAHCFGMSLTSERLFKKQFALSDFSPAGASSVWQLDGFSASDGSKVPSAPLAHRLKIQALIQFGSEVIRYYLERAGNIFASSSNFAAEVPSIREAVRSDLAAGNFPLVMLRRKGSGHVTVAYDLEDIGPNDFYIHIYDPNVPFQSAENTDPPGKDPSGHQERQERRGRIHVTPDGRWLYAGLNGKDAWGPGYFHSKDYTLVVVPYGVVPLKPTFPASLDGLKVLVFGSAGIAQVSDDSGRSLYLPDGTPNADPATRLAFAAPYAQFDGVSEPADSYILGGPGPYTIAVRGTGAGFYSHFVLGNNFAAQLERMPVTTDANDELTVDAGAASLRFRTSEAQKALATTLAIRASDGSERSVTLNTTSFRGGLDRISFDATRDALLYTHEGPATSYAVTLGRVGGPGVPGNFSSTLINIGSGDTVTLRPGNWQDLDRTPVDLTVVRRDGTRGQQTLANTAAPSRIPAMAAIVNAASFLPTSVAPGQLITIFGASIGPDTLTTLRLNNAGALDTTLADTRVLFDGTPAPLIYVLNSQLTAIVPYAVAGKQRTSMQVEYRGNKSNTFELQVVDTAPGIFTFNSSGSGPGAILNQDLSVNTAANPAPKGSIVSLFGTGEGQTEPPGVDGLITSNVLRRPVRPVSATIGGQPAEVLYAGAAPGLVAGVLQVNVRVPVNVPSGEAVPVVVTIGDFSTQPGVTLAIQ